MKRTLLLVCVATLALSGAASAQTYPQEPASAPAPTPAPTTETPAPAVEPRLQPAPTAASITGVVISTSPDSLVIETAPGTRMTFVVDSASTLPVGLTPSTHVTVHYHPLADGAFHAATVTADGGANAAVEPAATAGVMENELDTSAGATAPAASSTYSTGSVTTAVDTDADLVDDEMDTLPATASSAPLAGLAGLLALGAAALLRAARRE